MLRDLQRALDAVTAFIRSVGLAVSAEKTEALLYHPRGAAARNKTRPLRLDGTPLPWRTTVVYLGLKIDARITWRLAVDKVCADTKRIGKLALRLLAKGEGASPPLCARIHEAIASARALYALPLLSLSPLQWKRLDTCHRNAIRHIYGLPNGSQVAATYAETRNIPLSLRALKTALNHIERLHRAQDGSELLRRISAKPNTRIGRVMCLFREILGPSPPPLAAPQPPHEICPPRIYQGLPGVKSKRNTPVCALQQEAASKIHTDFRHRTLIFTDGSVRQQEKSAAAACVIPDLDTSKLCRLHFPSSSQTAEIAALNLAATLLLESPEIKNAAILTDSRAALQALAKPSKGPRLLQVCARNFQRLAESGCDTVLQWIPSHCGIGGNELADELARSAHHPSVPMCADNTTYDCARLAIARHTISHHPDPRIASGHPFRAVNTRLFARRDYVLLLRLRIGCVWTGVRASRLRGMSPLYASCGDAETLEHVLCMCPVYSQPGHLLREGYRNLGLPCANTCEILHPSGPPHKVQSALKVLLLFLRDSGLSAKL